MNHSKISVRYAKALFLLAKERNILDEIKKDIELVYTSCDSVYELKFLLESPVVKTSQKQEIFKQIYQNKVNELTITFLDLIIKNKREAHIKDIARNILDLFRKELGVKTAILTTAVALDETLRKNITEVIKLKFKTEIELTEQINKDLIGGFILRVDDQQYDASVSTKLNKLKKVLINKTYDNRLN